ncbi:hypothetical protein [Marinobacter sp. F4216]|uniref:hypothetical protein n=1 Tax=Marinobacter sp. F4216 TaxID=2874281 RepID=UPI001CBF57DE|nr:hypothetical protein [Marinobacter sp. F4216]MBZ2169448.1 hypothetical protein [Marinobacter sp. F4216]
MTELQFLTLISTLRSEIGVHGSNFFTVWTAYMIAAYLVSDKLSLTFSILVTVIYSTFLVGTASALLTTVDSAFYIGSQYREIFPETKIVPVPGHLEYVLIATLLTSWVLSTLFFLQQRGVLKWK